MNIVDRLDRRPCIVVLAGPNGAGKTTFFHAHLKDSALRFVNADVVSRELGLEGYDAARVVDAIRRRLVSRKVSFVFETVFSDPAGDKIAFLRDAERQGCSVVVCFIGLADAGLSAERVQMRVTQGGHGVPPNKLKSRYPITLDNLARAADTLRTVIVFDNSDLRRPFRKVAVCLDGQWAWKSGNLPEWLTGIVR